jgi:hypothetical protein
MIASPSLLNLLDPKFLTDWIEALGKVAKGVKAIVNMPKAERERIRGTLDETYRLLDTTLNMVIFRLGDVLDEATNAGFKREAARLDNYHEWMQAEREFHLCRSLRVTLRETQTLAGKLTAVSAKDWDALLQQMNAILTTEAEVARFIGGKFQQFAKDARRAGRDSERMQSLREALTAFRAALQGERQKLIQQEAALLSTKL